MHHINGYTTTYDYDLLNRLISQKTLDIDGNVVVEYIYTLGAAGERLKVEELDRTVEYTYDDLYRLTSETITEGEKVTTYTYAYDNVSNRILKTENGKETAYDYNSLNQLVSDSDNSYEYDLNGNLVRVIGSAQSALYEFNAENRLVKATVQQGNNVIEESYTYDYAGNRTSKTTRTNGHVEFVKYLNDNSSLTNVLAELGSDSTEKCVYTIGADLISQERDGKVSVYIYDGHGSVTALADESGRITDTYTYDAFGNLLKSSGKTANNYRYCGEQFDGTTEFYYLRARYMDATTGRFVSQDSYAGAISDPTSLHKYLYANSNPVMYSDPSGYLARIMCYVAAAFAMCAIICLGNSIIQALKANPPYPSNNLINDISDEFIDFELEFGPGSIVGTPPIIIPDDLPTDIIPGGNIEIIPTETDPEPRVEEFPIGIEPEEPYVDLPTGTYGDRWVESIPSSTNKKGIDINTAKTTKQATEDAKKLGYQKVNGVTSHGQPVFYNPKTKTYISPDVDSHNGGAWKMAHSSKGLQSKDTRMGTYDEDLKKIGG